MKKYMKEMCSPRTRAKRNPVRMTIFKRVYPQTDEIRFIAEQQDDPLSLEGNDPQALAHEVAAFQKERSDDIFRRKFKLEWPGKKLSGTPGIIIEHSNVPCNESERRDFLECFARIRKF